MLAPVSVYCADALCRIYIANTHSQFRCKSPHISHKMEVFTSHCAMARQAAVGVYMLSYSKIATDVTREEGLNRSEHGKPGKAVVHLMTNVGRKDSPSLTKIRTSEQQKKREKEEKQRERAEAREAKKGSPAQKGQKLAKGSGNIEKQPRKVPTCKTCGVPMKGHRCPHRDRAHVRTEGTTPRAPPSGFGA